MANIKVAVRVRPISARELSLTGSEVVVRAEPSEISLTNLKVSSSKAGDSRERTRRYGFDYCFDSSDPEAKNYADQATIYATLGQSVLDAMFAGYNGCLVAYGQSASGKTYTMMGTKEDPGLIPRLCEGILSRVEQESNHEGVHRVTVSYLEIYNERVRDLLKPSTSPSGLRVREHPRLGPYVQGLTHHVVRTLSSFMSYVEEGTKARKTASTLQNPSSSRSHALLTVHLSRERSEAERAGEGGESMCSRRRDAKRGNGGCSRLHLVDLAGSESAATCGGVHRLKEGANINKSLVALGNVISALAERGSSGSGPGRRYIPYRDSSLTWLLKDALGGNATTIMLATISPASGSYNETAHTLRFAQRAQSVVNRPLVNEDPVARLIRDLRAEVARLKSLLSDKNIQAKVSPCCCAKGRVSEDSPTNPENHQECPAEDESEIEASRDPRPIRKFNSTDSVATCETGCSIRKFNSCEHLQSPADRLARYKRAKVNEIKADEEDQVVDEINEPVFVDIPTLVAVLIKPDDNSHESSVRIEEICSDEVQEDGSIDFIDSLTANDEYEEARRSKLDEDDDDGDDDDDDDDDDEDDDDDSISTNSCNVPEVGEVAARSSNGRRGKFGKQKSVDLSSPSSNVSRTLGSNEGKEQPVAGAQRTNVERRAVLSERGKKLNNIREIDDRGSSVSGKSGAPRGNEQRALQRKSSNESDKSAKTGGGLGRKPSLDSLKRKTSKDSSSSSSKDEQIVISSLTRDKLLRRSESVEREAEPSARHHTAIQRVKRAEIVAAVTERLYSSRKPPDETGMASGSSAPDTRSPPEGGTDARIGASGLTARSRLQEISRKMLLRRRRNNVDTQTETASTLRLRDAASLTDERKVVLQDAAVLTDEHAADHAVLVVGHRVPVLRVKDAATLTDRRPPVDILRCRDAESSVNDLDFDEDDESRNDSGVLSDDTTQNYADKEHRCKLLCTDSSTNTFLRSPVRSSAVQTTQRAPRVHEAREEQDTSNWCSRCRSLTRDTRQRATTSPVDPERNVISISLPDMISITIESTSLLESRITLVDHADLDHDVRDRSKPVVVNDKQSQTDQCALANDASEQSSSLEDDLALRSTATQADGRGSFRIENIFHDPNSKSQQPTLDASSDAMTETKRSSVTLTNSLATWSVIGTKETATETEWRGERAIPKGGLTRAFIARRRARSLSPRRPSATLTLVRRDSSPAKSPADHGRRISTSVPSSADLPLTDNLSCRRGDAEEIPKDSPSSESGLQRRSRVARAKNKSLEHNFSDDSLDEDEAIASKSADAITSIDAISLNDRESFCPPDVVAHTSKREASKSAMEDDSGGADDADNIPRRKSTQVSSKDPTREALILRSCCVADRQDQTNATSDRDKKRVSFSADVSNERPAVTDVVIENSIMTAIATSCNGGNRYSEDAREQNEQHRSEGVSRAKHHRNILDEYLNEATTFMRNVNSINEREASARPSRGKRRSRKRGARASSGENSRAADPRVQCYERCLRSIERLEACIDKVGKHDRVLRDRYGIHVDESAGAKPSLACPSLDWSRSAPMDDHDHVAIDARQTRAWQRAHASNSAHLERGIFEQLMRAADCEPTRARHRCLWRAEDLPSPSPSCLEFRDTFRRHGGLLNCDQVPAWRDYLGDPRGIESSPRRASARGTKLAEDRGMKESGNGDDSFDENDLPHTPPILPLARADHAASSGMEEEMALRPKDSLRLESRFGGPLSLEFKYPGSPRAKFLELLRERRRIVSNSRGTNAF